MNLPCFHRYAGVWEYRLAGWLLANPFQQTRKFVSDSDQESWHTLAEYLQPYRSDHYSGRTLAYVLSFHRTYGQPMQPSDITTMPQGPGDGNVVGSRSLLAKKWCVEVQALIRNQVNGDGVDFNSLRTILANMHDALVSMDIDPPLWPDHARLSQGYVEPESEETDDV